MSGSAESRLDKVLIRGLSCHCIVGILPPERVKPQPLRLHLELWADFGRIQHPEDYANIVDYAAVSARVLQLVEGGEYLLLETMAEDVCAAIFADYPVAQVRLVVEKPEAVPRAEWVGIEVLRRRPPDVSSAR